MIIKTLRELEKYVSTMRKSKNIQERKANCKSKEIKSTQKLKISHNLCPMLKRN